MPRSKRAIEAEKMYFELAESSALKAKALADTILSEQNVVLTNWIPKI